MISVALRSSAHVFYRISAISKGAVTMANLVVVAFAAVVLFLLLRILNLTDSSRAPKIFASKNPFINTVLQSCPILFERLVKLTHLSCNVSSIP